ncbi:MAG: C4-dicarboxylate ABC transporter permease [Peptococcaceae bacterium BICA1-8]|nr:MAG: C4-dicarboxylate ABC transporter permease [Peptococcaceae bacterium BICA1-8]
MSVALVLFGSLVAGLAIGIPIAVAIGMSVLISFLFVDMPLAAMAQRMYASVNSFTLLAIPFFMLAGSLMETGGMSRRLVRFANSIVGTLAGGLAHVQVLASCFFAALSGSSPATTAAIGSALIPEMKRKGYPPEFSAAVQSISGTIGTIIPPSIPMVVYGVVANESIGKLFAAGFIPGLIYGGSFMVLIYFISKKRGYVSAEKFSGKECWVSFKEAIWALLVPIIILGGIYSGIFTPTEAGAVAAVYGLFAGVVIYKELNLKNIADVFAKSATNTAMVLLIISASSAFSWIMTVKGVASLVGGWFAAMSGGPVIFLLLAILLLLFMGCFMETIASVLIVTPVLLPVAKSLAIDPILFGIVVVMTLSLGMSTPPVGENLYIAASIAGISFEDLLKNIWPFIIAAILVILLITFVPGIALFLPNLFY